MDREFAFMETATADSWNQWKGHNFEIKDSSVRLAKETAPTFISPTPVVGRLRKGVDTIDIDSNDCGVRYLLGSDGNLYLSDPAWDDSHSLPCIWRSDRRAGTPEALCVNGDTVYVAFSSPQEEHSTEHERVRPGVHVVSSHLRPTRKTNESRPEEPFKEPTRIVATTDHGVLVLDASKGTVVAIAKDGARQTIVRGLRSPEDISVDPEGILYVLDTRERTDLEYGEREILTADEQVEWVLERYEPPERAESDTAGWSKTILTADFPFDEPACIEAVGVDDVVIGTSPASDIPGERPLFRYRADKKRKRERATNGFERVYSFQRSCARLRWESDTTNRGVGELYAIDGAERTVYFLEGTHRNKPADTETEGFTAQIRGQFDSGIPEMRWHRLRLDLDAATPGTQVRVKYAATDDERSGHTDWLKVKDPNPRDVLLTQANGRYLRLTLELTGSEYTSPQVRSIRAYLSRNSYLQYLPALYSTDTDTENFLGRFLTIFETAFAEFDDELAVLTRYFDPESAPEDTLSWLGEWLAVAADESWSIQAKRTLIERAPALFKKRGTKTGLLELLSIYLDQHESSISGRERRHFLSILEYADLQGDTVSEHDEEPPATSVELLSSPREFLVLVGPTVDDDERHAIERIVDAEKPAHTSGRTLALRPWARLGDHAYLGVNTYLPNWEFLVDESALGETSVLAGTK